MTFRDYCVDLMLVLVFVVGCVVACSLASVYREFRWFYRRESFDSIFFARCFAVCGSMIVFIGVVWSLDFFYWTVGLVFWGRSVITIGVGTLGSAIRRVSCFSL